MRALLAALVTVPFLVPYHGYPWVTFYSEWMAFLLAALLIGVIAVNWSGALFVRLGVVIPMALFVLLLLVHAAVLPYPNKPLLGAAYVTVAALLLIATEFARIDIDSRFPEGLTPVAPGLTIGTFLPALVAGAVALTVTGFAVEFNLRLLVGWLITAPHEGMIGTIGQRNMFAAYVAIGLIASLALRKWSMPTTIAIAVFLTVAEFASGSRAGWIYMLIAFISAAGNWNRVRLWCFCFLAFALARWLIGDELVTRPTGLAANAEEAVLSRWSMIVTAWRVWLDHPITGAGFGEFAYQTFLHARPGDAPGIDRHAHNIVMQLLAETGLIGAALFAYPVWAVARGVWREKAQLYLPEQRALFAMLMVIGFYSFTEFPLWHAQFTFMTAIIIGLLFRGDWRGIAITCRPWVFRAVRNGLLASSAAALMLMTVLLVQYRELEKFSNDRLNDISLDNFFKPNLELMIAQMLPLQKSGEALDAQLVLQERAMHVYPTQRLACKEADTLDALGGNGESLRVQAQIIYRGACVKAR